MEREEKHWKSSASTAPVSLGCMQVHVSSERKSTGKAVPAPQLDAADGVHEWLFTSDWHWVRELTFSRGRH